MQRPPRLGDTYRSDLVLLEYLERLLPTGVRIAVEPELRAMGTAAAGELARLADEAEASPPWLRQYDPWGTRVDRVEVSRAWRDLHAAQVHAGLAARPYRGGNGAHNRVVQHALLHLYGPSSAIYSCPVAMTDAAVRVLTDHAEPQLRDRVVPRLTARDPARAWTSGQWVTERVGGSDVARHETAARQDEHGEWRLYGDKWFTSAVTADCALVLARPDGAPAGSRGLGLFLVEQVNPRTGERQFGSTILINRLKDKLGTRALPTAELTLAGAVATPVGGVEAGLKKMAGMLTVARAHNAVSAAAGMRRGLDLAVAYGRVREASGRRLLDLPLFAHTLAQLAIDAEGSFALVTRVMELIGRREHGEATELETRALRALVPLAKLLTAKDAVAHASEVVEAFGGAGYIEDTGIPRLLRDAQVLPIWEGTTNVLSLDLLRGERTDGAVSALLVDLNKRLAAARPARTLDATVERIEHHGAALTSDVRGWAHADPEVLAAHARDFAVALGRAYTAALLAEHAAARLTRNRDDRAAHVATRYVDRRLAAQPPKLPTAEQLKELHAVLGAE